MQAVANKHAKLGSVPKKERDRYIQLLTNDPTDFKKSIIRQIYEGADGDSLAYMDGRDKLTGEIVPLLVGLDVEVTPEGTEKFTIYPVARLFTSPAEMMKYEPPDGRGNYVTESAELAGSGQEHFSQGAAGTSRSGDGIGTGETVEGQTEGIDEEQGFSLSGAILGGHNDPVVH